MFPEFHLGPITLRGYGLMVAVGLITCWWILGVEGRRRKLDALADGRGALFLWMLLAGWVGGKLFFIWTSPGEYEAIRATGNWQQIIGQGFVFQGSLLFCLPTLWWWLRKLKLPVLPSLDTVILAAPVMLGLGRVGCFLAGCCYGCRTDDAIGVVFDHGVGLNHVRVHPAQLYETLGCGLVFAWMWFITRRRAVFAGEVVATYFVLYGIERIIIELFRGDVARSFVIGGAGLKAGDPPHGVSFAQAISVPTILVGAVWVVWGRRRAARMAAARVPRRGATHGGP